MKLLTVFALFMALDLWARPVVLLSYFDAFDKAPFNNSEKVALALNERLKNHPDFELKLCALSTVFDKSFAQLENCLKNESSAPTLILGLGEANCNFKIEIAGRNFDKTKGPDNEGNERKSTKILAEGEAAVALNYPLDKMYCSLDQKNRAEIEVSNNAGTFVCNNLAYQFAHYYPEETFGFIHVPSNNCKDLKSKTETAIANLSKMIPEALKHSSQPLPIYKNDIKARRRSYESDACLNEFYKRVKGIDERGLWTF
ncbi:hypothetical protein ACJVC5_16585 [Peredibacter sp. HCB2-198]|uniref:pyroglutamyl-peptidase I family protein n=1 Tax=Peredibacter sp. HCB2-198 TaxID=3383025 RepID=UPI0038B6815A